MDLDCTEVKLMISVTQRPVLIEQQSILGFVVLALHVLEAGLMLAHAALVVTACWPHGPYIKTRRGQIWSTGQCLAPVV